MVAVACPFCRQRHVHGGGTFPLARAAHCGKGEYTIYENDMEMEGGTPQVPPLSSL